MASDKITTSQVLFPLALLSLVVMLLLAFQTRAMVGDREALVKARADQTKPLEETEKVKAQANALAVGTLKLAQKGNKDAINIMNQLKKAGIQVSDQPGAPPPAP